MKARDIRNLREKVLNPAVDGLLMQSGDKPDDSELVKAIERVRDWLDLPAHHTVATADLRLILDAAERSISHE